MQGKWKRSSVVCLRGKFCISEENLKHCHRLKEIDRLIVKFNARKHCQHVVRVKNNLINYNLIDLKFFLKAARALSIKAIAYIIGFFSQYTKTSDGMKNL